MNTINREPAVTDDSSSSFVARLRLLVGEDSVAAFARKCGIGESLMRSYLLGSDPGRQNVEKIWKGSGCSIKWLMTGEGPMYEEAAQVPDLAAYRARRVAGNSVSEPPAGAAGVRGGVETLLSEEGREFVLLPRYDIRVSAGGGSLVHSEQIVDHLAFQADWYQREIGIPPEHTALMEVRGNSMEPDLFDGDIVAIDTRVDRFVDDAIYVLRYGDALRIKSVQRRIDGRVEIKSSNEAMYKPEVITDGEAEQITVVGRARRVFPKPKRLP
jgi:phage repressor protein C with HTH and peptisase S24 domain